MGDRQMTINADIIAEFVANEAANIERIRALCGNTEVQFNALNDAEFSVVAEGNVRFYREKAATVKSAAAKQKWAALADLWARAA